MSVKRSIKRRHFLQFSGAVLASLGWSAGEVRRAGDRYAAAVSASANRKLALLVGVNDYPDSLRVMNLKGCVTDVELQRELLVHRFGFYPDDILTLASDRSLAYQPTRDNILAAFENHLLRQAQANDIVVIHYSGHGSRLIDPHPIYDDGHTIGLIPSDPNDSGDDANDITATTLFLLLSALPTDRVTAILDCCYAGGGTRGNVRVRAPFQASPLRSSPLELDYQQRWLDRLSLTRSALQQRRERGIAKGVFLSATERDRDALDLEFDGFRAGAFTYFLTQYLWHSHGDATTVTHGILRPTLLRELRQNRTTPTQLPTADRAPNLRRSPSIYFIDRPNRAAEAVIREVRGDRATVWLGGTVPDSLAEGITFVFDVVTPDGEAIGQAELVSREGLTGNVTIRPYPGITEIPEGALLRETTRRIPPDLELRIGIDPSLEDEAISAQQRLNDLPRTIARSFQDEETLYGGAIDYLFCRMTPDYLAAIDPDGNRTDAVEVGSLGLLSQDLREMIPDSFGAANESLEVAVRRLNSKLRSLLAAKLVKQTLNANASTINLAIALEIEGDTPSDSTASSQYRLLAQAFTVRGREEDSTVPRRAPTPMLRVGQNFNFAIASQDSNSLYILVLAISLEGIHFLFPRQPAHQDQLPLMKNGSLQIPAQAPEPGISEVLFIASRTPMDRARRAIATLEEERRLGQRQGQLAESEAIAALLDDLSDRRDADTDGTPHTIDNREIAALSFTFEVRE